MSFLLDTHVFAWWLFNDRRLTRRVIDLIAENTSEIFISSASGYEFARKYSIGKWPEAKPIVDGFEAIAAAQDFSIVAISASHAIQAGLLAGAHRDPFDRLIAAQAQVEGMSLISADRAFIEFGIKPIW